MYTYVCHPGRAVPIRTFELLYQATAGSYYTCAVDHVTKIRSASHKRADLRTYLPFISACSLVPKLPVEPGLLGRMRTTPIKTWVFVYAWTKRIRIPMFLWGWCACVNSGAQARFFSTGSGLGTSHRNPVHGIAHAHNYFTRMCTRKTGEVWVPRLV